MHICRFRNLKGNEPNMQMLLMLKLAEQVPKFGRILITLHCKVSQINQGRETRQRDGNEYRFIHTGCEPFLQNESADHRS